MIKKAIARVVKATVLAGTLMYGAIVAPELHNKFLRSQVGESVVQVLMVDRNGGGTGFAVKGKSGEDYIMTNRHVCEVKNSKGFVRLTHPSFNNHIYRKVIYMDTIHDLCLIDGRGLGLKALAIGSQTQKGDTIYVVGHPGLRQLTVASGEYIGRTFIELVYKVEKKEQCPGRTIDIPYPWSILFGQEWLCLRRYEALETTTVIYGGNSGSPVVNKWGHVIGVAFAGNTEQEHNNFIVPLIYVKNVLSKF